MGEGVRPWILGSIALIGAGITAFYMSRLFFMIFHGKARWTTEADLEGPVHPHESSPWMTVPMIILSVFSVGLGGALSYGNAFTNWLTPVVGHHEHGVAGCGCAGNHGCHLDPGSGRCGPGLGDVCASPGSHRGSAFQRSG